MADSFESRSVRQQALADKKRRLEEIKARKQQQLSSTNAATVNLDEYIDELLHAPPAMTAISEGPFSDPLDTLDTQEKGPTDGDSSLLTLSTTPTPNQQLTIPPDHANSSDNSNRVTTFEIAIQCHEQDFPSPTPSLIDEEQQDQQDTSTSYNNNNNNNSNNSDIQKDENNEGEREFHHQDDPSSAHNLPHVPPILTTEEKLHLFHSTNFTDFLSTASKRVERLLGLQNEEADGADGLLGWKATTNPRNERGENYDFIKDYAMEGKEDEQLEEGEDEDCIELTNESRSQNKQGKRKKSQLKELAYQKGGFFTSKSTYHFPRWTQGRNVTDIEWCPSHKEWVLASYNNHAPGTIHSTITSKNTSTRHLAPNEPSSSFLQTQPPTISTNSHVNSYNYRTSTIPNEGIIAIYNLFMPSRPEHIFCSGCPILHAKFHPAEHPKLVIGGGSSGQLLVWDARVGRYPVQKSTNSGTASGKAGHDCELVGMKSLTGDPIVSTGRLPPENSLSTAKLVTASSDGKINYWSVANLREPLEHVQVNANLSCLDALPYGNEGVICGDEKGGLHAIFSGGTTGTGVSKRVVRMLNAGGGGVSAFVDGANIADDQSVDLEEKLDMGHYGMVTAVAPRPSTVNNNINSNTPRSTNKETTANSYLTTGGMTKGFLRGVGGLVVTTGVDWSTKIWAPAYTDMPIMSFLNSTYDYMSDVQWSPVHPTLFATASSNGTLNLWNLATSIDHPISGSEGILIDHTFEVSNTASPSTRAFGLNRLKWSADGHRMAVASGDKLHVLGVGEDVWKTKGDEESRVWNSLTSRGFIQDTTV